MEIFEQLTSEILAPKNTIEIYNSFKQQQMRQLLESGKNKELQQIPVTVVNLFKNNRMRNFRVRGDGHETILEESSVEFSLDISGEE